jgi:molybdate transport system regulatory protein
MSEFRPIIRVRIWLEDENGEMVFGSGRSTLIENINEHGSLKKAAQKMRISYRAAWGKLKGTETILGRKLVDKSTANKEGYRLTEYGKRLNDLYKEWFSRVEKDALKEADGILPWDCVSYNDRENGRADGTR